MKAGAINSFHSLSAVDGPGLRVVVFMQGCPLRCEYCHNPETQTMHGGTSYTSEELIAKILRLKDYLGANGGLTITGGEPLVQTEFVSDVFRLAKKNGLNTCLQTSGQFIGDLEQSIDKLVELLKVTDYIYCDVKFTSDEKYIKHTKGRLNKTINFLEVCDMLNKSVIVRQVIVPTINDTKKDIYDLYKLIKGFNCIKEVELLPYSTMGKQKYYDLGMTYKLEGIEPCKPEKLDILQKIVCDLYNKEKEQV